MDRARANPLPLRGGVVALCGGLLYGGEIIHVNRHNGPGGSRLNRG